MKQILIVDDSVMQASVLRQILQMDYEVSICTDGLLTMEQVRRTQPFLILLDIIMPKIDGFELLRQLKLDPTTKDIPVILITSLTDTENEEKGLLLGAVDYITKPFHSSIVLARVRTHTQLYAYWKTLENLAQIDGLTGIANRRTYDRRSDQEWQKAIQEGAPISLGLLDIDYFKQFNDTYGHLSGDDALRAVANAFSGTLWAPENFAARFGGEEFAFVLSGEAAQQGERLARELRHNVEALCIPHKHSLAAPVLTVSIGGVTVLPQPGQEFRPVLEQVDRMLFCAKERGRNMVVWASLNASKE